MAYVRNGQRGMGRMAGSNRLSALGRPGGVVRSALGFPSRAQRALIHRNLKQLGPYSSSDFAPDEYSPGGSQYAGTLYPGGSTPFSPTESSIIATGNIPASGSLSAQNAALLSQAITTAGKVGTQAIIGTPTLTYNPLTGQYEATGGATLPSTLGLTSALTSYLPLILLAGGAILLFSAMGKR